MRFPHTDQILVGAQSLPAAQIVSLIGPLMTPERRARIDAVLKLRTYSVTPVLENIYDRGNASAVMRSSEAMGFQAVHLIEISEKFKEANRVTKGADKWLDVIRWKSTKECVENLRGNGYQILATHLDGARPIDEMDFTRPTALVFGNEKDGVSPELLSLADHRVVIPMHGFVQSFNISVAAAIGLYHVFKERERKLGGNGDLTPEQQEILRAYFYLNSSKNPERLVQRLLARN